MFNSFFNKSALKGPTPFKYSIGEDNMLFAELIFKKMFYTNIGVYS